MDTGTFRGLITLILIVAFIGIFFWAYSKRRKPDFDEAANLPFADDDEDGNIETTGHAADGIEEYDNPLPQWWFKLFILTVVFALGYLVLYPQEVPIPELARDGEAMQVAERIFLNNCAVCHGSNAQGGYGFPNLTDDDWLYGGEPENILTTLNNGRNGLMPSWQQLGENNIENLTQYVLSLSNLEHDEERAASGESTFLAACAACHTPSGTGNTALGAPNLTNDIWLYQAPGQSVADSIRQTLRNGRNGHMPAQAAYIGEERVHLVAAYKRRGAVTYRTLSTSNDRSAARRSVTLLLVMCDQRLGITQRNRHCVLTSSLPG